MRISHFCQFKLKHSNGVQAAVWELAKAQAALGEEVEIISLGREPGRDEVAACRESGVALRGYTGKLPAPGVILREARALASGGEQVVHFHSVFILWHTAMATVLRRRGVMYFVSPHGNLAASELRRKSWRKRVYLAACELAFVGMAAGCFCASPQESRSAEDLNCGALPFVLGNGTSSSPLAEIPPKKRRRREVKGISLGKSDVVNKGYDRMFRVSEAFEGGVDFYVVRHNQKKLHEEFDQLLAARPATARVHPPVHGEAKAQAFAEADCVVHLSRWEVFGMSIVEGAMAGLPLVLSEECDLAVEAEAAGAAHVMRSYDDAAIEALRRRLQDEAWMEEAGRKAREWALSRYSSPVVAARSIEVYRECLAKR